MKIIVLSISRMQSTVITLVITITTDTKIATGATITNITTIIVVLIYDIWTRASRYQVLNKLLHISNLKVRTIITTYYRNYNCLVTT